MAQTSSALDLCRPKTVGENLPEYHCFIGGRPHPGHLLPPLSPAENLGNLPPTASSSESDRIYGGEIPTIHGRLRGHKGDTYPSPPSTTSDPKHPVPLPSTALTTANPNPTSSNTTTNPYDLPYETRYDSFRPQEGPFYFGGLLDSPVMTLWAPNRPSAASISECSMSQRPSQPQPRFLLEGPTSDVHSDFQGLDAVRSQACKMEPLSPVQLPLSPTSPLLEFKAPGTTPTTSELGPQQKEDAASLLSPLSPEWDSDLTSPTSPSSSTLDLSPVNWRRTTSPSHPPPASSSSSKPTLPLLDIPNPGFSTLRSYAPSPTSPLWLADELDDSFYLTRLGSTSSLDTHDIPESSGSETEHGGDLYMVSPPSAGPPETPSPQSTLLPFFQLDVGDDLGDDEWTKKGDTRSADVVMIPSIPELFEYPSSPLISTRSLLSDSLVDDPPPLESGVSPGENVDAICGVPLTEVAPFPQLEAPQVYDRAVGEDVDFSGPEDGEAFNPELLRSPSVRFREYRDLPDDDDLASPSIPRSSCSPSTSLLEASDNGAVLTLGRLPTADQSSGAHYLLFPDGPPTPSSFSTNLDTDFDFDALDSDTLDRLPPQELEEVKRLTQLQERARECERMAKEMEEMAAEVASSGGRDVAESDNGSPGQMEGDVTLLRKAAVEARALAKREREKAKEAGMLVRLKLKEIEDQVVSEVGEESTLGGQALPGKTSSYNSSDELAQPESSSTRSLLVHGSPPSPIQSSGLSTPTTQTPTTPPSRKHPRLAGIAQLVAKMFLSRHETSVRRSPTMLSTLDLTPTPATSNEPSSSTSSSDSASSLYSSSSSSDPSLTPALNSSTPSSPSSSAPSTPKASPYKYKHLWMKGVASASLRPQPPSVSPSHGFGIFDRLGSGATRQQPFAQYQKRYKFLRSSPLAKYSVVASDEDEDEDTSGRDGELDPVAEQEEQQHHQDAGTDGGVGALWDDDEEDLDGGFEALRNPINWDNI